MKINNIYMFMMSLLLVFISNSTSFSQNIKSLDEKFIIFLEKEFLSNNVNTKTNYDKNNFVIFSLDKTPYLVSFQLLNKNINQDLLLIPTLKITRKSDSVTIGFARTLTFEKFSNLLEIETVSRMLVNNILNQLKQNGLKFNETDQKFKDNNEKKLRISINYFNSCESNLIIEIMENQFPGFVHLETDQLSTSSVNKIVYYTTATKYKIKKWLERSLFEFSFMPKDFFIKIYKSKLDLTKSNSSKTIFMCE